jgi:catechol 2,3-dioxygenase-like lactoylglutathione lyase family enzyme
MAAVIESLDHLVLTVRDLEATCRFYVELLGMRRVSYAGDRVALHFGRQKLNLHEAAHPIDPNVRHATPGSADLCFLTRTPVEQVAEALRAAGVAVIEGPVVRTGAEGPIRSIYCHDPDENLIELANRVESRAAPE